MFQFELLNGHILQYQTLPYALRSVTGLVSRGLVQEEKGTNKGDPYYKGIVCELFTPSLIWL